MTITPRGGRFLAQVRYKGVSIASTFDSKGAASRWRTAVRAAIDDRRWPVKDLIPPHLQGKWGFSEAKTEAVDDAKPHVGWTLDRAIEEYLKVIDGEKGYEAKANRLRLWQGKPKGKKEKAPSVFLNSSLPQQRLDSVSAADVQAIVKERLKTVSAYTVRNDVYVLSALFEHARATPRVDGTGGWGLDIDNPRLRITLPDQPPARERRLKNGGEGQEGEEERMRGALAAGPDAEIMVPLFDLALYTGMRPTELLDLRAGEVHRTTDAVYILRRDSKTGSQRKVTLSTGAIAAVDSLLARLRQPVAATQGLVPLNLDKVAYRWKLARKAAGVTDLRFRDLRHEGLSVMAEKGLNIGELQAQSGHRSAKILVDYINAVPATVAKKLG